MRQIILDTETTGLVPEEGHRVIEIGCVELVDRYFTGNNFHKYINPKRDIEIEAQSIHGITSEFLADKPLFTEIMHDFVEYVKDAELVIHNAPFDVGFLNYEFKLADPNADKIEAYAKIFDTLAFARKKHPGKKNNLDALCKRYNVDNTKRELHGALLDAQLLAEVYLSMTGGQMSLFGEVAANSATIQATLTTHVIDKDRVPLPIIYASAAEEQAHQQRLQEIHQAADGKCLWLTS